MRNRKRKFLSEKELRLSKNYIKANGLTYNKRYKIRKRNEKRMKEIVKKEIRCYYPQIWKYCK